ncbi:MAG: hypothetical protein L0219_19355 [Phycisphaerales bacterium]|nr:hypothetical protein [Phycisphaerales bacterium]MCI0677370.1 hypothetical protein [Phycisphaerales bacterium]
MKLHTLAPILAAVMVGCTCAQASVFVPVSQDRYVFQSMGEEFLLLPAPDFGPFSANLGAAMQESSIFGDVVFGSGAVGPDPKFSINSATSFFSYVFEVESATDFLFSGSLATGLFGSAAARLSGSAGDIVNITISEFESAVWAESGALAAGQYTLEVFASNSIGGDLSTFTFSFGVPTPATAVPIAVWLIGARARRRRNEMSS